MFSYNQLWEPLFVAEEETLRLGLGPLNIWIHRGTNEWHIAHENVLNEEDRCILDRSQDFPSRTDWTRWIIDHQIETIQLCPKLPDRPLIVRPEMPMCLMPKESVLFFVGIPIWLSIFFGKQSHRATEIPTMRLSNSWFGSVTAGELCYALKTTAKLHLEDLLPHPHRVIFPLEIRNSSTEKLNFERLCLHMKTLNIYQGQSRMWTNRGRVVYRGEEKWSRVVYARNAPKFDQAKLLLSEASENLPRGVLLQTFDNLKQLADF